MSGANQSSGASPPRRARPVIARADEAIVRGAPAADLDRPASEVFESIRWDGPDPDPDSLSAQLFLGWL